MVATPTTVLRLLQRRHRCRGRSDPRRSVRSRYVGSRPDPTGMISAIARQRPPAVHAVALLATLTFTAANCIRGLTIRRRRRASLQVGQRHRIGRSWVSERQHDVLRLQLHMIPSLRADLRRRTRRTRRCARPAAPERLPCATLARRRDEQRGGRPLHPASDGGARLVVPVTCSSTARSSAASTTPSSAWRTSTAAPTRTPPTGTAASEYVSRERVRWIMAFLARRRPATSARRDRAVIAVSASRVVDRSAADAPARPIDRRERARTAITAPCR